MLEPGGYPGNVRELRQLLEVAYERAAGADEIREEHVRELACVPVEYRR